MRLRYLRILALAAAPAASVLPVAVAAQNPATGAKQDTTRRPEDTRPARGTGIRGQESGDRMHTMGVAGNTTTRASAAGDVARHGRRKHRGHRHAKGTSMSRSHATPAQKGEHRSAGEKRDTTLEQGEGKRIPHMSPRGGMARPADSLSRGSADRDRTGATDASGLRMRDTTNYERRSPPATRPPDR